MMNFKQFNYSTGIINLPLKKDRNYRLIVSLLFSIFCFLLPVAVSAQFTDGDGLFKETHTLTKGFNDPCTITTLPFEEGFEGDFPPECWTRIQVTGTSNWVKGTVANTGTGSAYHAEISGDTYLVTPPITLPSGGYYTLDFWSYYTSPTFYNGTNAYCEIMISTTTNDPASFTTVKRFNRDAGEVTQAWQQFTISLNDYLGETVYIAFRYVAAFSNHGWYIDDVKVSQLPSVPVFAGAATLQAGVVYSNIPIPNTREYNITNKGGAPLIISDAISSSPEITVSGLPVTIGVMESAPITVNMNVSTLPAGAYNGNFVLATNDPENNNPVVNVAATVSTLFISPFIYENFINLAAPQGWVYTTFSRYAIGGLDNSPCLRGYIYGATWNKADVKTSYVNMGPNPICTFYYRATNDQLGNVMANADVFSGEVRITKDFGATWEVIHSIERGQHIPSTSYALVDVDVSAYANEICMVQIAFMSYDPLVATMWVDDITVGTDPVNELEALSIRGSTIPTVGVSSPYTVAIRNNGSAIQDENTYSVKLMKQGNIQIATLPGVSIAKNQTMEFEFYWVPDVEGPTYLYGEIVCPPDEFPGNNKTSFLSVQVQPEGTVGIVIGQGTNVLNFPYDFVGQNKSLTQTLYYPDEIVAIGGEITGLIYRSRINSAGVTDKNIKVWIGETTQPNLANGWVNPSTLTLAFDGQLNFPAGDGLDVAVMFNTPYSYQGGTLVVYSYKDDTRTHAWNDQFYGTTMANSNRSRSVVSYYDIDVTNPPAASNASHLYPNVTLMMNTSGMGSLSGVVTDANGALGGAMVKIVGFPLSVLTNAAGEYSLPYLAAGTYDIEVSKFNYFTETSQIVITANTNQTHNVTMSLLPLVTLSGTVTSSILSGGVENVTITLSGYVNYAATTNADGHYSIPNVYGGHIYNIAATFPEHITHTGTIEVTTENIIYDIHLIEILYPVSNVVAELIDNEAVVSWDTPGSTGTYILDDGTADVGWTSGTVGMVSLGNQFTVGETGIIKSIAVYGHANPLNQGRAVNINIYNAERQIVGTSSNFIIPSDSWITVPLNNIPYNGTFYAMVNFPVSVGYTNYIGFDTIGPNANANFDWYITNSTGVWALVHEATNSVPGVFLIRANVVVYGEEIIYGGKNVKQIMDDDVTIITNECIRSNVSTKTPEYIAPGNDKNATGEYAVYRLLEGQPESEWITLADDVTALTFTDNGWNTLAQGIYQYAVKAKYTSNYYSIAKLSNPLIQDIELFTVTVSPNNPAYGSATGGGSYHNGTEITVTATPNTNYVFVNWTENGNEVSTQATYSFTITDNRNLIANFVIKSYTITASVTGGNGTITPNGAVSVTHGNDQEFTFTPNAGYHIA
ncbi:MAG: carboxypeptidase regulatory-like domain-containing protein, partial [Lentimicrobiaceae bacterium]|nr:carboxypeptidase regulatory-like domain-containing protein [Lentimicrobiaceae bacterium]